MCIARVTIVEDDQVRSLADRAVELFRVNQGSLELGSASWAGQFSAAVSVNGDDDGDGVSPGVGAWIGHIIALPWKLLFACIPPTTFAAGWVCFVVSIVFIGVVTAVIGDWRRSSAASWDGKTPSSRSPSWRWAPRSPTPSRRRRRRSPTRAPTPPWAT